MPIFSIENCSRLKKKEINLKKKKTIRNRNSETTLFSLERNARQLAISKLLLTEHARENSSNIISPYLDSTAYHHELVDFIDPKEINQLYLIEYILKEVIFRIDFLNGMKKETSGD